jgi:hypothetical protein
MTIRFTKDPDAVLPYTLDWSRWLEDDDTVSAATADEDTGIVVDSVDFTDTTTTVVMSGGTAGTSYDVVVHVTTSDGYEDDRTITFAVKER